MIYVKKFRDTNLQDIESVGGKNSSLGEMIQSLRERKINKEKVVLDLLIKAIKQAGYEPGKDINLSLDVAASSVYKDGKYYLGGEEYTSDDLIMFYQKLIKKYPIIAIEDGLAEDDWMGWKKLQKEMGDKITLIGDDIFVTNTKLIKKGIDEKTANAVLIKPNQIGTLTATMNAIELARKNNWKWVVSHRSGETLDTVISDIAFATGSYGLKTGSPHQRPGLKDDEDVRRIKYKRMAFLENHEEFMRKKLPVGLIILDGWGIKNSIEGNAIKMAKTPNFDYLIKNYPNTFLSASGVDVGLPMGEMGNSEVGHLNIGAGRVIEQEVSKIDKEIKNGLFYKNKTLINAFNYAYKTNKKIHLIGLVSNAIVHSSMNHLMSLIEMASKNNFKNLCVHIITDGRDSSPLSAKDWISKVADKLEKTKTGKIVSICGRYYAMDRDNNWDRTERAYRLYVGADGIMERDWKSAIQNSYNKNITDEFILPTSLIDKQGKAIKIEDDDVVVSFNFRADRLRQLTRSFMDKDFDEFSANRFKNLKFVCLTEYDTMFNDFQNLSVVYHPIKIKNTLGEILSENNLSQLRISETEKYAHVTYFLNGGCETNFLKEQRILVDSPKEVATYDLKPEMSSQLLTEKLLNKMSEIDFFVLNFPNPDMVGHTGNLEATIKAIEAIDEKLGLIYQKAKELGYTLIVTADHGNAEEMDKNDLDKLTSHSVNPVPFVLVDIYNKMKGIKLKSGGRLADIAPTILDILSIRKPFEMSGRSLIIKKGLFNKVLASNTWIKEIQSEKILDSRGKSTIQARVVLNNDFVGPWAMVPAGKSTGKGEAPVVIATEALQNIKEIEKVLIQKGLTVFDQIKIDKLMMDNLAKWGGNTTLAISLALAKAGAMIKGMELYEYLRYVYPKTNSSKKVRLLMNVFNGGLHALCDKEELGIDKVSTQEFMINILADSYNQAIKMADDVYNNLSEILFNLGYDNKSFGDEGGYSPKAVNGIRVPEGFSVTADAYFYFMKETGIWDEIVSSIGKLDVNDIPNLRATSQKLRKLIVSSKMPKDLENEIKENYEWLSKLYNTKNISVAVRSSATAEDLDDASFAGQHESYLNVVGVEELIKITKECFASLFTERALVYRNNLGVDHLKVALSVGVQKMVRSDKACAGVMFSCDTESGFADVVLINSSYGLGENIVKGRVETDEFFVFEKTMHQDFKPIIEKRLGAKEWTLIYNENGKGIKNLPTPNEKRKMFSLTDDEVLELTKASLVIENHYNKPMDIEWAKDGIDGKLYIVQARPETIQSRKDVDILKEYKIKNVGKKVLVEGMAVGSKIGQGKVKIIKNIKDMEKFKKGDVLVTYMTDPDWVPIMKIASAIVTESGSRTCFGKNTLLLTNLGFMTIVDIVDSCKKQEIYVTSLNEKTLEVEWKKVLNGFVLKGDLNSISISQTGRKKRNSLDVTMDHKFLTFENRNVISLPIEQVIKDKKYVISTKEMPQFQYDKNEKQKYDLIPELGFLMGGMLTDGSLFSGEKTCSATFIQKEIPSKKEFIEKMNSCLEKVYGETFHRSASHVGGGIIRGKLMRGEASQFRCYKKKVVQDLIEKRENICEIMMLGNEEFLYNFLAGVVDGDGSYNKASGNRINIYCSNDNLAQALAIACLRLGIEFQTSNNRIIYNIQIVDKKIEKIFEYTKRVKGTFKREKFGMKLFAAKQLLADILERVNYKGRIRPYVNKNLLIDGDKIRNYVIPMISGQTENHELTKIVDSSLMMLRADKNKKLRNDDVYNIEVEDNHNYFVFTKYLTPVAVANCHAAIVGRELGIPTIVAADKATTKLKEGSEVTASCAEGQIGKIYDGKIEYEIKETNIKNLRKPPVKITLNVGDPNSVFVNSFAPNEGVGLAREEFIVANFIKIHPSALINYKKQSLATKKQIDELTFGYKNKVDFYVDKLSQGIGKICAAFYPKEVILRFSDFKTNEYRNLIGGEMYEPKEENPMIGWRGASRYYHPDFIEAFKLELKAVDKVVKEFGLDNLSLMVPFCRTVEEGKKVKEIINQHCQSKCKIYVMCEIPSNVILADKFLDVFDGMSIGSNDLTQLVLGLDRDGGSLIASIGNENNEAVKQMVKNVIKTCKERGKYIGICGQAPSDYPEFAKFLIQNKIDSMSLNPDSVLKIIQELNK